VVPAVIFVKKYNLNHNIVSVVNFNGHKFTYKEGSNLYVDELALLRRRRFYTRVWEEATSNYYIITSYIRPYQLAEKLHSELGGGKQNWSTFLHSSLFSSFFQERSLLSYKINKKLWKFWRFTNKLIKENKWELP